MEWDTNFDEVTAEIKKLSCENATMSGWHWPMNTRCKYISLRIDMRDGAFVLLDRDGKRITLEQLRWQYSEKTPNPPGDEASQ